MIQDMKVFALEELRAYIVFNSVEIHDRDDLLRVYLKMHKEGYFYKVEEAGKMREIKKMLNDFSNAYEKDADILEEDLVRFGAGRVLDKIEKMKKR